MSTVTDFKEGDTEDSRISMRRTNQVEALEAQAEANEEQKKHGQIQWENNGGSQYFGCGKTKPKLAPGLYTLFNTPNRGIGFSRNPVLSDEIIRFEDSVANTVLHEIDDFWQKGKLFKQYNFLHRRGYMFYGPPGSGKTSLVAQIVDNVIGNEGVAFLCDTNPSTVESALRTFRDVEPNRPLVCLFEDIDAIIENYGEHELLCLLDGENNIDKVLNIATTNYPEKLDRRIAARPRRFDRVIKIDMPTKAMRSTYFQKKMKIEDTKELANLLDLTDNFSFASCADLVISVKCLDKDVAETAKTLRELGKKKK